VTIIKGYQSICKYCFMPQEVYFSISNYVASYFKLLSVQLKHKPYNLFLLTSILLLIVGLFSFNTQIDIHLHDTYFVFPLAFLVWVPSIILFAFWVLYLMTKQFLFSKRLMWTHIILTIVTSFLIFILPYLTTYAYGGVAGIPRRYYDYEELDKFKMLSNFTNITATTFILFLLSQLTYCTNLFIGLYKPVARKKH
jgi:cytochrome c oxidase subunit I